MANGIRGMTSILYSGLRGQTNRGMWQQVMQPFGNRAPQRGRGVMLSLLALGVGTAAAYAVTRTREKGVWKQMVQPIMNRDITPEEERPIQQEHDNLEEKVNENASLTPN
jgi:hypothetical protein